MTKKEYKAAQEKVLLQIRRGLITIHEGTEKMLQNIRTLQYTENNSSEYFVDMYSEYHRMFLDLAKLTR